MSFKGVDDVILRDIFGPKVDSRSLYCGVVENASMKPHFDVVTYNSKRILIMIDAAM